MTQDVEYGGLCRRARHCQLMSPKRQPSSFFVRKLQTWKRPQDVLAAFAKITDLGAYLVFARRWAGTEERLLNPEGEVAGNLGDRVRFLGFVNQSGFLPRRRTRRQTSCVLLLRITSHSGSWSTRPCCANVPVIVSDRVGARYRFDYARRRLATFPSAIVKQLSRHSQPRHE